MNLIRGLKMQRVNLTEEENLGATEGSGGLYFKHCGQISLPPPR